MNIDFSKGFIDLEGAPVIDQEGELITLGKVVANSLVSPLEDDKGAGHDKVLERWKLAMKLHGGGEHDLTASQAAEIQKRIAKTHTTIVAAQVIEALNG